MPWKVAAAVGFREQFRAGGRCELLMEGVRMLNTDTLLDLGQEWREFAACSDRTDDLFFPSSESDISMARAAKAVCQSCPVQEECLQYSLDTGQTEGIWGGLTSRERRVARRRRVGTIRRAS